MLLFPVTEGLRKRKGALTESSSHNSAPKLSTFDFDSIGTIKTDFGPDDGFQKAVRFTPDRTLLLTGGSDGHLRAWKVLLECIMIHFIFFAHCTIYCV